MRFAKYLGVASTALVLTVSAMAQNAGQLVAANAELETNINAKTAKVGDSVTAKLTGSVVVPGGTELRSSTLLIGHIDQVQPAGGNGVSTVVLTFDQARPKGGQPIPIKSTIVGLYPQGTETLLPHLNPQFKTEEIPSSAHGYTLTSDVQGANSGVLKEDKKNVHLQAGTEMQFAIAASAAGSTASGN